MNTFIKQQSLLNEIIYNLYFLSIKSNSQERQSTIARFDPIQNSWAKLGNLEVARIGHGAIQFGNEFIVIGGNGNYPTESCKFNGQSMTCTTREPTLSNFYLYPELMLIP